ncbi:MAG: TatD family hydrolase [Patescibacteria group bacterium]
MLIDSHCHLIHKNYEIPLEQILSEAKEEGVDKFITIGTSIKENLIAIQTAEKISNVYCSIGIYPHEDKKTGLKELENSLKKDLKRSEKIIAVGECGIDISNWENGRSIEDQTELFEMQIKFAKENSLPLIVHNRNGDNIVLELFEKHCDLGLRGVVHCFNSNWEFAKKVLDLGFCISFTNLVTYPKKEYLLEVVKNVPMNRFLVETDSPYLPPQSFRGEKSYPKYVRIVAEKVAQVKQKTFEEVSKSSYENTCKLFNI